MAAARKRPTTKNIGKFCVLVQTHRDPQWALQNLVPARLVHEVTATLSSTGFKIPTGRTKD